MLHHDLVSFLADEKVLGDLEVVLEDAQRKVEIADGQWVRISDGENHEIILRSFYQYTRGDIGMGDHYRVLLALGGTTKIIHGLAEARIGFATLWYSPQGRLVTVDFSRTMP